MNGIFESYSISCYQEYSISGPLQIMPPKVYHTHAACHCCCVPWIVARRPLLITRFDPAGTIIFAHLLLLCVARRFCVRGDLPPSCFPE